MMEWQPIETAPEYKRVHMGGWIGKDGSISWHEDIAFKASLPMGTYLTHWKPLPDPPK